MTRDAEPADVDLAAAMRRFAGNVDFYRQVYDAVRTDADKMLDRLGELTGEGQTEEAERLFHSLKGLAATIGATGLALAAAAGEQAMRAHRQDHDGANYLQAARTAYAKACEKLDAELARVR